MSEFQFILSFFELLDCYKGPELTWSAVQNRLMSIWHVEVIADCVVSSFLRVWEHETRQANSNPRKENW